MRTVTWDLETRSAVSLRECGAYIYSIDPTTQPLCVLPSPSTTSRLWLPLRCRRSSLRSPVIRATGRIAHNYEFERAISGEHPDPALRFPPIPKSAALLAAVGLANAYPAELDLLAQALGLPYRKDPAAERRCWRSRARRRNASAATVPTWDEIRPSCSSSTSAATGRHHHASGVAVAETETAFQHRMALSTTRCDHQRAWNSLRPRVAAAADGARRPRAHGDQPPASRAVGRRHHNGRSDQALSRRHQRPRPQYGQLEQGRCRSGAGAQARRLRAPTARIAPHRRPCRGQQVQKDAGLRGAGRYDRPPKNVRRRPGRWAKLGPQLQNLKKNESNRRCRRLIASQQRPHRIAQYGNPLALGDISRAALAPAKTWAQIRGLQRRQSVVLAWLANER